jgi:hypothetical protein
MHCLARVTSVSKHERDGEDGACHRVELQIIMIADEPEDEDDENEESEETQFPNKLKGLRGLYQ